MPGTKGKPSHYWRLWKGRVHCYRSIDPKRVDDYVALCGATMPRGVIAGVGSCRPPVPVRCPVCDKAEAEMMGNRLRRIKCDKPVSVMNTDTGWV